MGRIGVILANTGTPDGPEPEQVAVYLEQFLSNPRIVPINKTIWNIILHKAIIPKRSVASSEKYKTIWTDEGFMFLRHHERLAAKVEQRYKAQGKDVLVRVGMSFGNPSLGAAASELNEQGCEEIVVIPLYPQNAYSNAVILHDAVREVYSSFDWGKKLSVVGDYSHNLRYRNALVQMVLASGFDVGADDRLLMSYHSIPMADVKKGDSYDVTTFETSLYVAETLGIPDNQWMAAYQSRFENKRKWLSPYVYEIMSLWASEGIKGRLFVMCPGFSVDSLETYYEVEVEQRQKWFDLTGKSGDEGSFVYIPCLNDSDAHADIIMDLLGI